jgi:hypothetical protein
MNSVLIRSNWSFLYNDLWMPLSKSKYAPDDMFNELFRYASRKLRVEPKAEILNDLKLAKQEFKKLPTPIDEKTCLVLLEGYYDEVFSEFNPALKEKYRFKLQEFIVRHNLRYFLTPDCRIRLSLVGLIVSQYASLKKTVSTNPLRDSCLIALEKNIGLLKEDTIEENCIQKANNLLEGVAIDKTTTIGANTFGRAINGCRDCFPHQALIDSAKKFYEFSSDFPNLRHGGIAQNPGVFRGLKKDDAILSISFAVLLASFIVDNDASQKILMGDF